MYAKRQPIERKVERLIKGKKPRHDPLFQLFAMIKKDNPPAFQELVKIFEKDNTK